MYYHYIEDCSQLNGDGLRVVLWVSGCTLRCIGCQNPETHQFNSGKLFDENAENELFDKLKQDYIQGITFSGGHPLEGWNLEECTRLCKKIREKFGNTKDIWLYTGFIYEDVKDLEIMKYIDVLVDGPFNLNQKESNLKWKGSRNQRVIDVQKSLEINEIILHRSI